MHACEGHLFEPLFAKGPAEALQNAKTPAELAAAIEMLAGSIHQLADALVHTQAALSQTPASEEAATYTAFIGA
jgi:hypothetical protein